MLSNATALQLDSVSFAGLVESQVNFWGRLIRNLRDEQKISQRQLAAKAKVNRSTLRRIEDNEARGDIDIIERLLNFLGYELEAMAKESVQQRLKKQAALETNPEQRAKLAAARLLNLGVKDTIQF